MVLIRRVFCPFQPLVPKVALANNRPMGKNGHCSLCGCIALSNGVMILPF